MTLAALSSAAFSSAAFSSEMRNPPPKTDFPIRLKLSKLDNLTHSSLLTFSSTPPAIILPKEADYRPFTRVRYLPDKAQYSFIDFGRSIAVVRSLFRLELFHEPRVVLKPFIPFFSYVHFLFCLIVNNSGFGSCVTNAGLVRYEMPPRALRAFVGSRPDAINVATCRHQGSHLILSM